MAACTRNRPSIDEHALDPVWINALSAHGFIRQNASAGIVTVHPGIESANPLLGIRFLEMGDRDWLYPHAGGLEKVVKLEARFYSQEPL